MDIKNITKGLGKLFYMNFAKEKKTEIKPEDYRMFIDPANVFGIIPKNEEFKKFLESFYDMENREFKLTDYDYQAKEGEVCKSKYSVEYLEKMFDLIKSYESVIFKLKKDFPLWAETDDFICILAPRVEEDE